MTKRTITGKACLILGILAVCAGGCTKDDETELSSPVAKFELQVVTIPYATTTPTDIPIRISSFHESDYYVYVRLDDISGRGKYFRVSNPLLPGTNDTYTVLISKGLRQGALKLTGIANAAEDQDAGFTIIGDQRDVQPKYVPDENGGSLKAHFIKQ